MCKVKVHCYSRMGAQIAEHMLVHGVSKRRDCLINQTIPQTSLYPTDLLHVSSVREDVVHLLGEVHRVIVVIVA